MMDDGSQQLMFPSSLPPTNHTRSRQKRVRQYPDRQRSRETTSYRSKRKQTQKCIHYITGRQQTIAANHIQAAVSSSLWHVAHTGSSPGNVVGERGEGKCEVGERQGQKEGRETDREGIPSCWGCSWQDVRQCRVTSMPFLRLPMPTLTAK